MNVLAQIPPTWRRRLVGAGVLVLVFGAGFASGTRVHPRQTVTVDKTVATVANESSGLDLQRHEVKDVKPSVKTRIIYRDGPIRERIVERTGGSETTTDTGEKVRDDLHVTQSVTEHRVTVTAPEGRWSFRVLAGADTGGSVVAGAGVDYRLVGPLTIGAFALGPVAGGPGRFTVGVSAGLRLP